MFNLTQLLIICPLIFLAGFVDAIGGGGGLISLPAYLIAGFPVHVAIGSNKLSAAFGSVTVTLEYLKKGFVPIKLAFFSMIFALTGSALGAEIALMFSDKIFKILMLFILPATAFYVFRSKKLLHGRANNNSEINSRTYLIASLIAFSTGVYDGFYGPGAGTFMILLLTGLAKLSLQNANGVAKVMNMSTNLAAITVFMLNGKADLMSGIIGGIFSIAGNITGAKLFERGGANIVRPIILIVLTIFFARVIFDLTF